MIRLIDLDQKSIWKILVSFSFFFIIYVIMKFYAVSIRIIIKLLKFSEIILNQYNEY